MCYKYLNEKLSSSRLNQTKTSQQIMARKKRKLNFLKCAELGTIFYGVISLVLYLLSLLIIIAQTKKLISAVSDEYEIVNRNSSADFVINSNYFILTQFFLPLFFILASIICAICFFISSFFKIGNTGNDDLQLGVDLVLIEANSKITKLSAPTTVCTSFVNDELADHLIADSKSPSPNSSPSIVSPMSSPLVSSSSISSSSSPPLSSSSKSITQRSKDDCELLTSKVSKKFKIQKETSINDELMNTISILNKSSAENRSYYFNFSTSSRKSFIKFFYMPSICSMFHLAMCFCLLLSRLFLDKFKLNYELSRFNTNKNSNLYTFLFEDYNTSINSLKLVNYYYQNRNNTNLMKDLFKELSQKINLNSTNKIKQSRFEHILSSPMTTTPGHLNTQVNLSNIVGILIDFGNKMHIDLNYLNYFIAFLMFLFKFTKIYSKANTLYAFLVFVHLLLFALLNFSTFPAFEIIFKTNNKLNKSKSVYSKSNGSLLVNKSANSTDFFSLIQNKNYISNANLQKLMPDLFDSEVFMLSTYILSWLLNLVYLSSLNVFAISFYRDAQAKIKTKYENYLNKYGVDSDSADLRNNIYDNYTKHKGANTQTHKNPNQKRVKNQYKAIIIGIFVLLITETCRLPFVYSCYIKYFVYNLDIYLLALMFQLVYLLYNALFWIILSFKKEWLVRFTPQFRILLWHHLYSQHFNEQHKSLIGKSRLSFIKYPSTNSINTQITRLDTRLDGFIDDSNNNFELPLSNAKARPQIKPKSIAKLKLNKSNKNNSKLYLKKQQKSDRGSEKSNPSLFLIENKSENENFQTYICNESNKSNYSSYLASANSETYKKRTKSMDNPLRIKIEDLSESSSSSCGVGGGLSDRNMHDNGHVNLNYACNDDLVSVPTYSLSSTSMQSLGELANYRHGTKPKKVSYDKYDKQIFQSNCDNSEFGTYSVARNLVSSVDFLRDQEYQWELERLKQHKKQNKNEIKNYLSKNYKLINKNELQTEFLNKKGNRYLVGQKKKYFN